jgi:hypothetical protein
MLRGEPASLHLAEADEAAQGAIGLQPSAPAITSSWRLLRLSECLSQPTSEARVLSC